MENLTIAINFIKSEGIKLVNVGAEDINSGKCVTHGLSRDARSLRGAARPLTRLVGPTAACASFSASFGR